MDSPIAQSTAPLTRNAILQYSRREKEARRLSSPTQMNEDVRTFRSYSYWCPGKVDGPELACQLVPATGTPEQRTHFLRSITAFSQPAPQSYCLLVDQHWLTGTCCLNSTPRPELSPPHIPSTGFFSSFLVYSGSMTNVSSGNTRIWGPALETGD